MKKKLMSVLLAGAMVASLVACGSSTTDTTTSDNTQTQTESTTTETPAAETTDSASTVAPVRLLNGKPEINDQMQALAAKYQEETGNVRQGISNHDHNQKSQPFTFFLNLRFQIL